MCCVLASLLQNHMQSLLTDSFLWQDMASPPVADAVRTAGQGICCDSTCGTQLSWAWQGRLDLRVLLATMLI